MGKSTTVGGGGVRIDAIPSRRRHRRPRPPVTIRSSAWGGEERSAGGGVRPTHHRARIRDNELGEEGGWEMVERVRARGVQEGGDTEDTIEERDDHAHGHRQVPRGTDDGYRGGGEERPRPSYRGASRSTIPRSDARTITIRGNHSRQRLGTTMRYARSNTIRGKSYRQRGMARSWITYQTRSGTSSSWTLTSHSSRYLENH